MAWGIPCGKRLQKQIADLHAKLATESFATRCTATQLVHAIAFPLAATAVVAAAGFYWRNRRSRLRAEPGAYMCCGE